MSTVVCVARANASSPFFASTIPVRLNGREGFDDRHALELAFINDQDGLSHHSLPPHLYGDG
jgi:hypothetical protein